jgi:hypothetical protein
MLQPVIDKNLKLIEQESPISFLKSGAVGIWTIAILFMVSKMDYMCNNATDAQIKQLKILIESKLL